MTTTADLPALPALVPGVVSHARRGPIDHAFQNHLYQWLVDLDHLPRQRGLRGAFAGFSAADHLGDPRRSIKDNIVAFVSTRGVDLGSSPRVVMLASARVLGYVFNPLSVHWCFDSRGQLRCIVAEVHNTYGERHAYLLQPDQRGTAETEKAFYVSPFYDVAGRYALRFTLTPERVTTTVALRDPSGRAVFTAGFRGTPEPATRHALAAQLLRRPLMPQRVSALIRAHGIWLWLRRVPIVPRPDHARQEGV